MTAWVLHVDLDQFLAAVEVLRHPELAGLPVIVGGRGDPTERAVVSTASYEARAFGVRSGMPLRIAVRRCPEAVLLPLDLEHYIAVSDRVFDTIRALPGTIVEPLGWDEGFIGVETDDPVGFAESIQDAVLSATELHCSVGIGDTKVRAKIATDFGKPRGHYVLTRDNWFEVMGDRAVDAIWGIGPGITRRLATLGVRTVRDLSVADVEALAGEFGPTIGPHLGRLGSGISSARVDDTPWVPRAHGRETTFQRDLVDPAEVTTALQSLAVQVVDAIGKEGRPCARVHLKVRFAPFFTVNRSRKLPEPTTDPEIIARTAAELLAKLEDDRPIRLLGIRAEMTPPP